MQGDEQRDGRDDTAEQDTIEKLRADLSEMQERLLETSVALMQLKKVVTELIECTVGNQAAIRDGAELTGKLIAKLATSNVQDDPDDPYNVKKRLGPPM
jgi:hypothetical protein